MAAHGSAVVDAAQEVTMPTSPSPSRRASFAKAAAAVTAASKVVSAVVGLEVSVGQTVLFEHCRKELVGKIAFVGTTGFGNGRWVGIILDTPTGKHDGSVRGDVYFSCPPLHGLFIRPQNVVRVLGDGESRAEISTVTEPPPAYARVVAALPPPEARKSLRTRSLSRRTSAEQLHPSAVREGLQSSDVKKIPGGETRALLDALRSEQAAHAECLDRQTAATANVGNLEQQVAEHAEQLSTLRGRLQRYNAEEVAQASEHATELAILKDAHDAAQKALHTTENDVQVLRAALQAARESEMREVEECQRFKVMEERACIASREEVQTLVDTQQKHVDVQRESDLAVSHSRETCEAARDRFTAESLALKEELHARTVSHSEKERALRSQLDDAATGRAVLLAEVEAARCDCKTAETRAKTQQHSFALQIEAAALAASTRELEALRGITQATHELQIECQERQKLLEELENLRLIQDQSGRQMATRHATGPPRRGSRWVPDSLMSTFCCARAGANHPAAVPAAVDRGSTACISPEADAGAECRKKDPELTADCLRNTQPGPGTIGLPTCSSRCASQVGFWLTD